VVGDLAGDELVLARIPGVLVVGAGELDRRLNRLRAARGEEDAVQVAGRELGELRGQLDRPWVGVAPDGVEVELGYLARGGLAELGATVPGVDAEQRREAVEVAIPVLVPDIGPLAAGDDRHLVRVVIPAHSGEVHPQVPAR
jgi:hypothetical protein